MLVDMLVVPFSGSATDGSVGSKNNRPRTKPRTRSLGRASKYASTSEGAENVVYWPGCPVSSLVKFCEPGLLYAARRLICPPIFRGSSGATSWLSLGPALGSPSRSTSRAVPRSVSGGATGCTGVPGLPTAGGGDELGSVETALPVAAAAPPAPVAPSTGFASAGSVSYNHLTL